MRVRTVILTALTGLLVIGNAIANAQPPEGRPAGRGEGRGPGRPAGPMFRPGQILPPAVVRRLDMTTEQQEQLEVLQAEVRQRLSTILTEEQMTQIREMASRGPGGDRRGFGRRGDGPRRGPEADRGRGRPRPDGVQGERRRRADGERPERAPRRDAERSQSGDDR